MNSGRECIQSVYDLIHATQPSQVDEDIVPIYGTLPTQVGVRLIATSLEYGSSAPSWLLGVKVSHQELRARTKIAKEETNVQAMMV